MSSILRRSLSSPSISIIAICAPAVALCLICFGITGHVFDTNAFTGTADRAYVLGQNASFYWPFSTAYLGVLLFFLSIKYAAIALGMHFVSLGLIGIKLPLVIGYMATALGAMRIARTLGATPAQIRWVFLSLAGSYLIVFVSFVHGMFDVLVAGAITYALAYFVEGKFARAGVLLGIAAALKLAGFALLPICLVYLIKRRTPWIRVALFAVLPVAVTAAFYIPIVIDKAELAQSSQGVALFTFAPSGFSAFSLWAYLAGAFPGIEHVITSPMFLALYACIAVVVCASLWVCIDGTSNDVHRLLAASVSLIYLLLALNPVNFPQYALWAAGLAAVVAAFRRTTIFIWLALLGPVAVLGMDRVIGFSNYLLVTLNNVPATPFDWLFASDGNQAPFVASLLSVAELVIAVLAFRAITRIDSRGGAAYFRASSVVNVCACIATACYVGFAIHNGGGYYGSENLRYANLNYTFVSAVTKATRGEYLASLSALAGYNERLRNATVECLYFAEPKLKAVSVNVNGKYFRMKVQRRPSPGLTIDQNRDTVMAPSVGCLPAGAITVPIQRIEFKPAHAIVAVSTQIQRASITPWWASHVAIVFSMAVCALIVLVAAAALLLVYVVRFLSEAGKEVPHMEAAGIRYADAPRHTS